MPIPVPTIPGVAPDTWATLLQALQAQGTDVATITEQGITTLSQLKQWLAAQGFELVEISEVVGYTIAKVSAVDPANTNAVSTQVVTDIATVGGAGTAVSTVTSGGPRTLGLVTKIVAVGAALSLLVSTIGAGLVTDEIQEDLITSAEPYTIDGEHIPVLIDSNGKTYFSNDFIDAIRNRAIDLGVFSGVFEPDTDDIPIGSTIQLVELSYQETLTMIKNHAIGFNVADVWGFTNYTYAEFIETIDFLKEFWQTNEGVRRHFKSGTAYEFYFTPKMQAKFTGFGRVSNTDAKYELTDIASFVSTNKITYNNINAATDGEINAYAIHIPGKTNAKYNIFYNAGGSAPTNEGWFTHDTVSGSEVIYKHVLSTGTNVVFTVCGDAEYIGSYYSSVTDGNTYLVMSNNDKIASSQYMTMRGFGKNRRGLVFNGTQGEGVEGITPAGDLIDAGIADTTKTLTDIFPEYATTKLQTANPTDEDITNKRDWYPVSINHDDVFTDGATEDETSTAPQGDVKPELEPEILDLVRDLIDTITPNPTIPVGDSGDTPPENPPLTPGSGATGSNGLWSIYNPSLQAVHDFGAWLWSDTLADQFKRIFNSPIDGVIGFHMIYCTPSKGTAKNIQCGFLQSPVVSDTVANQYVEIDCGTVTIGEYYRNALDYDNTSIALYLPFIGIVPLDTNIVMGSDISILYRIDVLTGTCLAQVTVSKENSNAVMYAFDGNCSVQIPLTATTYTGMVGALLGGLSASVSFMAGDMFHAVTGAASAMSSAMGGKTGVKQSGTMGANAGALGIRKPYVIITHPISAMPAGFENVRGLPSTELVPLGSVTGYTSVRDIHLEGIPATAEEINEIKELLSEGVIL